MSLRRDDELLRPLQLLARSHGIQTEYRDVFGRERVADAETLLAVLRTLGAPLGRPEDAREALHERRLQGWRRLCEPVGVAWDGKASGIEVRLPGGDAGGGGRGGGGGRERIGYELLLEDGGEVRGSVALGDLTPDVVPVGGELFRRYRVDLPDSLPLGYHRLRLDVASGACDQMLIAAPARAFPSEGDPPLHTWGIFLPLYALRTARSEGTADLRDLRDLIRWVNAKGGGLVASLPMLAAFLDDPFEPSPYSPVSRLFWNELYLDLEAACDLAGRPEVAVQRLSSEQRRAESAALRREDLVDYRRAMAHKRPILEELAQSFFDEGRDRSDPDYRSYLERAPRAEDYARFRATVERHHATWQAWPERQRDGTLQDGDFDLAAMRAHLFAQYALDRQFLDLAETTRRSGPGLYLDFPLGVNGGGYDVWRERDSFAIGASGGAPPDLFFRKGQDWGFPPPHPERIRETGYRYQIDSLRRHLRYAGVLRIDHVMGLHRLYWVPWGMEATRGAYVRYHADELFAILALESRRAGSMVVGENLGTVPKEVNEAMERHGIRKMFVLQYEIVESAQELPAVVPPDSVASVNTHDMATFRSFLEGLDIARRVELGFLSEEAAEEERAGRRRVRSKLVESLSQAGWIEGLAGDDPGTRTILEASLSYLAASESEVVVASLEDLWLEAQGQNVPGTTQEHPNWRRKARYDLEGLDQLPAVTQLLARIDRLRGERDGEAGRSGERDREEGRREGESGA